MNAFLKSLAHAALGGGIVGLSGWSIGMPITSKTVLIPALASAVTSVLSFLARSPFQVSNNK